MSLLGVNNGDAHLATGFQQQFYYRHYLLEPLNRIAQHRPKSSRFKEIPLHVDHD
jgi:hypothetical protein